ncbi:hypothetical protein ACLOJK_034652, partial [Asimina triloba]
MSIDSHEIQPWETLCNRQAAACLLPHFRSSSRAAKIEASSPSSNDIVPPASNFDHGSTVIPKSDQQRLCNRLGKKQ